MKTLATLCAVLLCLAARIARAETFAPPSTFGVNSSQNISAPGHGWLLEFDAELKDWILVHIPPRSGANIPNVEEGTIRGVVRLASTPATLIGLAAVDDVVYVLLEEMLDGQVQRRVMMTRAIALGTGYVYEPPGRLAAAPRLQAGGEIEGFAGTALGPAICVKDSQRAIQILADGQWRAIALPKNLIAAQALQLVPDQSGRLVIYAPAARELFLADLRLGKDGNIEVSQWASRQLPEFPPQGHISAVLGEEIFGSDIASGKLTLIRGGPAGMRVLGTIDAAPPSAAIVPLAASGHAVVIWSELETRAGGRTSQQHTEMSEVSIHTGRPLYRGRSRTASPISADDVRTLVILLIIFMSSVLVVLLRPIPEGKEVSLPEGASLADSSRRALGGVLDLAVAVFITVKAFGLSGPDLLSLEFWFSIHGIELLIGVLLVGFIVSTMGEAMIGRSLGKLVTGCEVISLVGDGEEGDDQPKFRQVLIRNAVKWLIPPITLSILLDPTLRHRGDLLARTAVVVWAPREDDDEDLDS